jgi:hypothetical protein
MRLVTTAAFLQHEAIAAAPVPRQPGVLEDVRGNDLASPAIAYGRQLAPVAETHEPNVLQPQMVQGGDEVQREEGHFVYENYLAAKGPMQHVLHNEGMGRAGCRADVPSSRVRQADGLASG